MHHYLDVVGIHYENKDGSSRSDFVRKIIGDNWLDKDITMELRREKGNRNDKNAIAVYVAVKVFLGARTQKIGYLDRDDARDIAPQIDCGGIISNLSLEDVWIPDHDHVTPRVRLSFDSSWSQEDVDRQREEKRVREREKRQARKLAKQAAGDNEPSPILKLSNIQPVERQSKTQSDGKEKSSWWPIVILWIVVSAVIIYWMG